ncbi:MAG: LLM class flavin-dependent oxidoreductase, partial [Pseudomonadota bacterium]
EMLETNLMFGSPDQVVEKLGYHKEYGADAFIYYASMGMEMDQQKRSLQLFIDRVMPQVSAHELAQAG